MRAAGFTLVVAATLVCVSTKARAHGDVHERINLLTAQIAQKPSNAPLYFERAELYRVDGDFTNALADFDRAAKIDPSLKRVDFCRGRVLFEAGREREALAPLNKYLAAKPEDSEAYTTRARTLRKIGNFKPAAEDYTTAIALTRIPSPELYIERAECFRGLGKLDDAIHGLDEGIRKFGPLVTLELPAIDLEVVLKRYDAALARIEKVSARWQRKETWLVRRAEVLKRAGREAESKKSYADALAALDRLPPAHRNTRASLELETRIRAALATNAPTAK
jgi:tetratricopeptide (TPR) repeat protein